MPEYIKKVPNRNSYCIDPDDPKTTFLTITRNDGSQHVITLNTSDVKKAKRHQWRVSNQRAGRREAATGPGHAQIGLGRFLFDPADHQIVHYIDGDPLNNRRSNVQIVTRPELEHDGGHGVSKERHVVWRGFEQPLHPWVVLIRKSAAKVFRVGSYKTVPEAVVARDAYLADQGSK